MSDPLIRLDHVDLVYPVFSMRAQSIRHTVLNLAVGGRLLRDSHDLVMVRALEDVNLSVTEGDRLGVWGHNGAGKSTLLKVIAGIYEPARGQVTVRGRISSMLDIQLGADPEATGLQNIMTMGHLRGFSTKEIKAKIPEIVEFSELGGFVDLPLKAYSSGMAMRLVFAVATTFEPDILLMDEWIGAGDAHFADKASERMMQLVGRSRAMVLATHSEGLLRAVCNKLLVLDSGRVAYLGEVEPYFEGRAAEAQRAAQGQLS